MDHHKDNKQVPHKGILNHKKIEEYGYVMTLIEKEIFMRKRDKIRSRGWVFGICNEFIDGFDRKKDLTWDEKAIE